MLKNVLATLLITSGIVLSYISFFTPPRGEVAASVLEYTCQTLIWAGSMLGITSYVNYKTKEK